MAVQKSATLAVFVVLAVLTGSRTVWGQGCVAVRPMSCSASEHINTLGMLEKGQWQVSSAYRYFKSFRHFRGDVEESDRVEHGTQVENITHAVDLGVSRGLSNRFGLTLNVPIIYYDRSSLYEHYGNSLTSNPSQTRFDTGSRGIGDVRVTAYYWLFNPEHSMKGNILLGLGLKAPTGNSDVQDDFHRRTADGGDSVVTKPVDQSIQLGDGTWGLNLELQGFHQLFARGAWYFNGFYLLNPANVNHTLTRGTLAGADPLIAYHSAADQYAIRLGITYALLPSAGISGSLGGRLEGIPSHDLIGDSEGFRRPGYIVSLEPSVTVQKGLNFTFNVPIALYRNRTKSVFDLADPMGQRHGDAAFADYLINLVVTYKFGKKHGAMPMPGQITIPNEHLQNP